LLVLSVLGVDEGTKERGRDRARVLSLDRRLVRIR
jgi:hypothetical protein